MLTWPSWKPRVEFPCWIIADIGFQQAGLTLGYCVHGHGSHGDRWCIVLTSDTSFGRDDSGFTCLEDAIINSAAWKHPLPPECRYSETMRANKITRAKAGGTCQLAMRTRGAARLAQFRRYAPALSPMDAVETLISAIELVREPRLFATERGYQGQLASELDRLLEAQGNEITRPLVEQEYQKRQRSRHHPQTGYYPPHSI
jgi:hypothetical protein